MNARGFVFSLDAFVAFVLIMITVNLLIFTIGTPKPYQAELESAHILARDTLSVLASSGDAGTPNTYLERILGGESAGPIMKKVAGGNDASFRPIIPRGYGYRLESLDLDVVQAGAPETWATLYDAGSDTSSDRWGKNFTKLQASATVMLSLYDVQPAPGKSPFCYGNCFGYVNIGQQTSAPCNVTPCDVFKSNFGPGSNMVRILRLVVYT